MLQLSETTTTLFQYQTYKLKEIRNPKSQIKTANKELQITYHNPKSQIKNPQITNHKPRTPKPQIHIRFWWFWKGEVPLEDVEGLEAGLTGNLTGVDSDKEWSQQW